MSFRARIVLVAIWLASLAAVGLWAQTPPRSQQMVISGSDLGFRVDRQQGNAPVGRLVVRVNGQWVEAQFAAGLTKTGGD
jgi:hypothetical protein